MREPNQHPGHPADPCSLVICGASGDLTKRKLNPALYNLANDHLLSSQFAIVGFARAPSGRLTRSTSGAWNLARYWPSALSRNLRARQSPRSAMTVQRTA